MDGNSTLHRARAANDRAPARGEAACGMASKHAVDLGAQPGLRSTGHGAVVAALAFALLASILLAESRALHIVFAAAALGIFLIARAPARGLLALVPFAAIANLETWISGGGSTHPSETMLIAATAAVAVRQPAVFRFSGSARIALAYGAWLAIAALVATWVGGFDAAGWSDAARLLRSGFLAASLAALGYSLATTEDGAALWSRAALGAAGLLGSLAIGEAIFDLHSGVPKTGSIVGGSGLLALHLTLLIPPGLVLASEAGQRSRDARILLLSLAGAGLFLSFSRSGWVGCLAAILSMGVVALGSDRRVGRRLLMLAAALLAGGVLAVAARETGFGDGEFARAYGDRLHSLARLDLFADRAEEWRLGVSSIREHPWFGQPSAPNPYNLALDLAAKSGLPALLLFGWFVAASLASGIRATARSDAASPLALGLIGAVVAVLVTGVGESTLGARMTPTAFATLGVLAGIGARGGRGRD